MKLLVFPCLVLLSQLAFALPVVESVSQISTIETDCPACLGGKLVTRTTFKVSEVSCGRFAENSLQVNIADRPVGHSRSTEKFVSVSFPSDLLDCMGPALRREYTVVTQDLEEGEPYILANPSRLQPFTP